MQSIGVSSPFTVSVSLWLLVSIDSIASSNLLKSICSRSKSPLACETAFRQNPRSEMATTPKELSDICLDLAVANATKCMNSVKHLQTLTTTPPAWKPALETCAQQFNFSAMEFRMGKIEMKRDPLTGSYDVMVAMDGAEMCDEAMKKDRVNLPVVTGYGENIRFFALIGNDIASLIKT